MTALETIIFINRMPEILSFADRKKLIYLVEYQNKLTAYDKEHFRKIKQIINKSINLN